MKEAGIREARQNLSALIEEVRKGHEVTITDRGRPVARLVPPHREAERPFAGRADFRRRMPVLAVSLTSAVIDERAERD
jgi:prevent-host-death family protein